jgi:hypothetical protein
MARCPFAEWRPVSYDAGAYTGGPFRIVHHTTEGSFIGGALAIFAEHYAPHFVVDGEGIVQLIDTSRAATALRHSGEPETNRLSAVQIEVVGFAGKAKDIATLENVRRLCRWIEDEHSVPRIWPAGVPVPAVNGKDAGHHNRNPLIWSTRGGHYGHEHVPNNSHWDPAYTASELAIVMAPDAVKGRVAAQEWDYTASKAARHSGVPRKAKKRKKANG